MRNLDISLKPIEKGYGIYIQRGKANQLRQNSTGKGNSKQMSRVYIKATTTPASHVLDFDLPVGSRHCSLLPFFDDLGNICLMIRENGVPRSSPVSRRCFSHTLNPPCTPLVSRRLNSASSGVTSMHALSGLLRCRQRASPRAKKSPQRVQNEKATGCASFVSQCRLKPSQSRNPAPGQSRHFNTPTDLRFQSAGVAASRVWYLSFSLVEILKRSSSPCSPCSLSFALCSSTCCSTPLLYWCHVPPFTLSSIQVSSSGAIAPADSRWTLGPGRN